MSAVKFQNIPVAQKISVSTDPLNSSINKSAHLANESESTSNGRATNNDETYTRLKRGLGNLFSCFTSCFRKNKDLYSKEEHKPLTDDGINMDDLTTGWEEKNPYQRTTIQV